MRDDLPSVTAAFVALARGVASAHPMVSPPLRDEAAKALLPRPASWLVPGAGARRARAAQALLRVASAGLVDQMAMRSSAIDEALLGAIGRGVEQVVILGAGLDARAYRLSALSSARVFEVDHPATQHYKIRRLSGLTPSARELVHVSVDFARDSLGDRLAVAGHDLARPTFWIWEGVTMYLTHDQTRATLEAAAARSAPGSAIALTYMIPDGVPLPGPLRAVVDVTMGAIGEPLRGAFAPPEMASLLSSVGFAVRSDECSVDWARRFGGDARLAIIFRGERLAVAETTARREGAPTPGRAGGR